MAKHINTVKATVNSWEIAFYMMDEEVAGDLVVCNWRVKEMRDNKESARKALKREYNVEDVIIESWRKVSETYEMPIDEFIAHATRTA